MGRSALVGSDAAAHARKGELGDSGNGVMSMDRADASRTEDVAPIARKFVDAGRSPGIVLGVINCAGDKWTFAFGNAGGGVELSGDTVFELGSVGKVFTAVVLADLVERHTVGLTDPVARHLPPGVSVPSRGGREITLEDLATHRSGLPRLPTNLTATDPTNPLAAYTVEQLYEFLATYELSRDIDTEYEYSNTGYGLLGHALAFAAGIGYEELVAKIVLDPLGMDDTTVTMTSDMQSRFALPHDQYGDVVPRWDNPALLGAGGFVSTMTDMLKFASANLGESGDHLRQVMASTHVPRRPVRPTMRVGLGWHIYHPFDRDLVWYSGESGGSHSFVGLDGADRRAVVVLTNGASLINDLGFHLLDPRLSVDLASPTAEAHVPSRVLDEYVGTYQLGEDAWVTVTRTVHGLMAEATGQGAAPMRALTDSTFVVTIAGAEVEFRRQSDGRVVGLTLRQHERVIEATKVA